MRDLHVFSLINSFVLLLGMYLSPFAHSSWEESKVVDSFTGETSIVVSNNGIVKAGDASFARLAYLKTGQQEGMTFSVGKYICDFDLKFQMRVDQGSPVGLRPFVTADKETLFISNFKNFFTEIVSAQEILILLYDGCGERYVAEFKGSAEAFFPQVIAFKQLDSWVVDKDAGYLITKNKDLLFSYREIVTGDHDMGFKVNVPKGKKFKRAKIEYNEFQYDALVYPSSRESGYTHSVFFKGAGMPAQFFRALMRGPVSVAIVSRKDRYELTIENFEKALPMVDDY
jgi:hypothetical protein